MCFYRRSGRGLSCALCYVFLAVALNFHTRSSAQPDTVMLVANQLNVSLLVKPSTAEEASKQCWNDAGLGVPGILAPATIVLHIIQEIISKNVALLQANIRQDPAAYNTGGSSLWVMDPWGGCRAVILPTRLSSYTGAVELSMVPCNWSLQSLCVEYEAARSLSGGLTLPHNLYRTPAPPPLPPPVPCTSGSGGPYVPAPPGYRLVHTGVKLGYSVPPAGAFPFSSRSTYIQYGPVINFVGRWRATGLDALRVVHWGDTSGAVEVALAGGNVSPYFGDKGANLLTGSTWTASPLVRETAAGSGGSNSSTDNSGGALRTSYITRMEGCSSITAVQRLILVSAGGAVAAQGVARCISNFAEEVAPGGFLAFVEGYYTERPRPTNTSALDAASIVQLWFVWAVPENYTTASGSTAAGAAPPEDSFGNVYGTGGVRSVAPRLEPVVPKPQCDEARALIPVGGGVRGRPECGSLSTERFACPSYMCCGAARGRVGICGTLASSCLLSSCDASYGLCGVVPFEALEVTAHEGMNGIAPARSELSSPPPYTVDTGTGPDAKVATAIVRLGTTVFVLDRSSSYQYASAQEHCRSQTLMGLSWQMITLSDAFAFEVSVLARTSFLLILDNRLAWAQPRSDNNTSQNPLSCLTVSWDVDAASVQLVAIQAADCSGSASVICKAAWPSVASEAQRAIASSPPPPQRPAMLAAASGVTEAGTTMTAAAANVQWIPGVHSLSYNLIGIGEPNSGPACAFNSYGWFMSPQEEAQLAAIVPPPLGTALPSTPVPIGLNVTLTQPIAGIATRPLVLWSAIASDTPAAYQSVGSLAVQYSAATTTTTNVNITRLPIILGSLDGTYLYSNSSDTTSYSPPPPDGGIGDGDFTADDVMSYMSAAAGWHGLQLDLSRGEVVVEVAGCRGALLELVVLRTSTGRLWSSPIGAACSCSVPFRHQAPAGGYLVALKAYGGYYVEEVMLMWATPLEPAPPPPVAALASSRKTGGVRRSVLAITISVAVLVPLPAIAALVAWWLRRNRRRRLSEGKDDVAAAVSGSLTDGSPIKQPKRRQWKKAGGAGGPPDDAGGTAAAEGCGGGGNGAAGNADGDGSSSDGAPGCVQLASVLILGGWASGRPHRQTVRVPIPDPDGESSRGDLRVSSDDSPSTRTTHYAVHGGSGGAGGDAARVGMSMVPLDLAPAPASLGTSMATGGGEPGTECGNSTGSPRDVIDVIDAPGGASAPDVTAAQAATLTQANSVSASAEGGKCAANGGAMGQSSDAVTHGSRPHSGGAAGATLATSSLQLPLPRCSDRHSSGKLYDEFHEKQQGGDVTQVVRRPVASVVSAAAGGSRDGGGDEAKTARPRTATTDGADSSKGVDVSGMPMEPNDAAQAGLLDGGGGSGVLARAAESAGLLAGAVANVRDIRTALQPASELWLPAPPSATGGRSRPVGPDTWAQQLHDALLHKVLYQWKPNGSGVAGGGDASSTPGALYGSTPTLSHAVPHTVPSAARSAGAPHSRSSGGGGAAPGPRPNSRGTTGSNNNTASTGTDASRRGRSAACADDGGLVRPSPSASQPQVAAPGRLMPIGTLPSTVSAQVQLPEGNVLVTLLGLSRPGPGPGLRPGLSATESPPGSMLSVPWPPKALSGSPHSLLTMAAAYATGTADRLGGTAPAAVTVEPRTSGTASSGGTAAAFVGVGVTYGEPAIGAVAASPAGPAGSRSSSAATAAAAGSGGGSGSATAGAPGPALHGLPPLMLLEPQQTTAVAVVAGGGAPITTAEDGSAATSHLLLGRDVLVDTDNPDTYLGHGTSGIVRRGLLRQPDGSLRPVAVKLLNRPNDQAVDAYRKHLKTLLQEMTILGSLRHPNIVQLLGGSVSLSCGASFLVEELCGRTLSHAIYDESTPYSLSRVLRWCADIACGLAYLHPNIMHRDLKPSNVLLDGAGNAKISDFGLARFKVHTTLVTRDAEVGTTCYMSPECFVSNDYKVTAACDVYSLGVMMNEMVTRTRPWSGVRMAVVGFKVAVVGDRPAMAPPDCSLCPPPLRDLIMDCWAQQPEERPSSAVVLSRLRAMLEEAEAAERAEEGWVQEEVMGGEGGGGRRRGGRGDGGGAGCGPGGGKVKG